MEREICLPSAVIAVCGEQFMITAKCLADVLSDPPLATPFDQGQRLIFNLVACERQQIRRINNADEAVRVVLPAPNQIPSNTFLAKTFLGALEDQVRVVALLGCIRLTGHPNITGRLSLKITGLDLDAAGGPCRRGTAGSEVLRRTRALLFAWVRAFAR